MNEIGTVDWEISQPVSCRLRFAKAGQVE